MPVNQNLDCVIFDLDGTLTSTNELIFASFNHITSKYSGKTYTPSEICALFGPTEEEIISNWYGDKAEEVIEEYYKFYEENHIKMAYVYAGVHELLEKLESRGILLAIFTGKGLRAAYITLKKLSLLSYFDMIISGDNVKNQKPSGEGIELIIDQLRVMPENTLMVGDSLADIIAAKSANVSMASALWDCYAKEEVLMQDTDFKFYSIGELGDFLFEGYVDEKQEEEEQS